MQESHFRYRFYCELSLCVNTCSYNSIMLICRKLRIIDGVDIVCSEALSHHLIISVEKRRVMFYFYSHLLDYAL